MTVDGHSGHLRRESRWGRSAAVPKTHQIYPHRLLTSGWCQDRCQGVSVSALAFGSPSRSWRYGQNEVRSLFWPSRRLFPIRGAGGCVRL